MATMDINMYTNDDESDDDVDKFIKRSEIMDKMIKTIKEWALIGKVRSRTIDFEVKCFIDRNEYPIKWFDCLSRIIRNVFYSSRVEFRLENDIDGYSVDIKNSTKYRRKALNKLKKQKSITADMLLSMHDLVKDVSDDV